MQAKREAAKRGRAGQKKDSTVASTFASRSPLWAWAVLLIALIGLVYGVSEIVHVFTGKSLFSRLLGSDSSICDTALFVKRSRSGSTDDSYPGEAVVMSHDLENGGAVGHRRSHSFV